MTERGTVVSERVSEWVCAAPMRVAASGGLVCRGMPVVPCSGVGGTHRGDGDGDGRAISEFTRRSQSPEPTRGARSSRRRATVPASALLCQAGAGAGARAGRVFSEDCTTRTHHMVQTLARAGGVTQLLCCIPHMMCIRGWLLRRLAGLHRPRGCRVGSRGRRRRVARPECNACAVSGREARSPPGTPAAAELCCLPTPQSPPRRSAQHPPPSPASRRPAQAAERESARAPEPHARAAGPQSSHRSSSGPTPTRERGTERERATAYRQEISEVAPRLRASASAFWRGHGRSGILETPRGGIALHTTRFLPITKSKSPTDRPTGAHPPSLTPRYIVLPRIRQPTRFPHLHPSTPRTMSNFDFSDFTKTA